MYVADAHAWLWYLSKDDHLGDNAERAFDSADSGEEVVLLPGIVVAESVYVAESHGYDIKMEEVVKDLKISRNYRMKPVDHRLVVELVGDDRDLSIHDKIIVLTAEQLDADIISKDREINSLANEGTVW